MENLNDYLVKCFLEVEGLNFFSHVILNLFNIFSYSSKCGFFFTVKPL